MQPLTAASKRHEASCESRPPSTHPSRSTGERPPVSPSTRPGLENRAEPRRVASGQRSFVRWSRRLYSILLRPLPRGGPGHGRSAGTAEVAPSRGAADLATRPGRPDDGVAAGFGVARLRVRGARAGGGAGGSDAPVVAGPSGAVRDALPRSGGSCGRSGGLLIATIVSVGSGEGKRRWRDEGEPWAERVTGPPCSGRTSTGRLPS